ncbi:hypothetical protein M404DRAFT_9956 [Pisolithus tinctorius Marx 270]|uniref:Uncharacterized protein n=1 Tax=Pisolithus tinctorius Marx 270 TaxID=870435 RepID=A0A0C3P3P0_PISTI|nr:hypothetical protein M404DRAFT_9956 [Pisolithus tinctorius Marx 270]
MSYSIFVFGKRLPPHIIHQHCLEYDITLQFPKKSRHPDKRIKLLCSKEMKSVSEVLSMLLHGFDDLEPLLNKAEQQFVLYPIQYPEIWDMYKTTESTFWITEQIQIGQDDIQWNNHLNDGEHSFVSHVIIFFIMLHGIHIPNLLKRLSIEIHVAEAQCFYGFESMIENVHSEVYCVLINTFIKNSNDQELLFDAVKDIPALQQNMQWALQWISDDHSTFAICLVIFATMKTIACSTSFAILIWLTKRQLLPALNASNKLIC